jgi:hypothetical protein
MYPAGCEQPDHEGKLPLHEALWHNASPQTLSVLLMASPSTLHERDKYGRTPMELNRSRTGEDKEQVKDMLMRGIAYWENARAEAVKLTQQGDDENILKNISMRLQKGAFIGDVGDESVEPMTWEKLEQRAIYLEQLLSDMYEKNYELGEQVDRLTTEKMQLQDTLDRLQDETHSKEAGSEETVKDLCEELDFLRREISRLKKQLRKKNKANAEEGIFDVEAIRYLEWSNATLQNELQEMTERNRENEVRLARLEIVATKLRKKLKDSESRGAAQPESTGMEDDKNVESAREDFMDLLAMLSHQSPLATERFLADKVMRLEAQLGEASRSSELSSAASFQESERMIRENETLQKRVRELSAGVGNKPPANVVKGRTTRQGKKKTVNPYATDSLDDILHQAAGLYSEELSSSKELAFSCFPEPPKDEGGTLNSEGAHIFPSSAFPNDSSLQAIDESSGTGTWDSSHVKLLDAYGTSADAKKDTVTEPRRLKLVEIASQGSGSEVVVDVPRIPSRTGPYSSSDGTERDGSFTISEVSMDSLLRSKRSLRPPSSNKSDSSSSLMRIPADVIVALRTASFSTEASADIETLLQETETVLGRPIPNDVKALIRAKYRAEGGDLSKLLLAWLKEALGDSEGSVTLSIDDLSSIFAGADKIAEQMISADEEEHTISDDTADNEQVVSEDTELSPAPVSDNSSENQASVIRRQWAAAFEETARYVSQRRLTRSPSISPEVEPSSRFNPDLVSAEDLNQIIADAANIYSLPLISSRTNQAPVAQSGTGASNATPASPATQSSAQSTSVSNATNSLIDDLIRDYRSKYS